MPVVTFVTADGDRIDIDAPEETSVRDVAIGHMVEGIVGECGGNCSCATCHVIIEDDWYEQVGEPHTLERDLLSFLDNVTPTSRLSCQIRTSDVLDGLVVQVPPQQQRS